MFIRIILATDLSPEWENIVACAGQFRTLGCSQIFLIHLITAKHLVGVEEALRSDAQPKLERQKKRLEEHGFKVEAEMPLGLPRFSINEAAHRHGVSLIVLGSCCKSLWRRATLGSFATPVLQQSEFPMLLLNCAPLETGPHGNSHLSNQELLRHVLFPTDFSENANMAFGVLRSLISCGLFEVSLLHALETWGSSTSEDMGRSEITANYRIQQLENRLRASGLSRVHSKLAKGNPVTSILDSIREADYSLVLMATKGRNLLEKIFLGSTAFKIARMAACPVLLVPKTVDEE